MPPSASGIYGVLTDTRYRETANLYSVNTEYCTGAANE